MSVITAGTTFSNGEQLTADKLNLMIRNATFDNSAVDLTSTFVDSNGAIVVKDSGITEAKIASNAVTTNKIANASVTFGKLTNVIDDDTMATASATTLATSESIKAYVDGGGGFTPSTYAGGESVTLPNGLIMKFGTVTSGIPTFGVTGTISFASLFPTACIYATFINNTYNSGSTANNVIESVSTSQITYKHGMNPAPSVIYWQAIGY